MMSSHRSQRLHDLIVEYLILIEKHIVSRNSQQITSSGGPRKDKSGPERAACNDLKFDRTNDDTSLPHSLGLT